MPKYDSTEAEALLNDASIAWRPLGSAELLPAFSGLADELEPLLKKSGLHVRRGRDAVGVYARAEETDGVEVKLLRDELVLTFTGKTDHEVLAVKYSRARQVFEGPADAAGAKRSALAVIAEAILSGFARLR